MADDGYVVFSENFVPLHQILHDHAALCIYVPGPTVLASIAKEGSPHVELICKFNYRTLHLVAGIMLVVGVHWTAYLDD